MFRYGDVKHELLDCQQNRNWRMEFLNEKSLNKEKEKWVAGKH